MRDTETSGRTAALFRGDEKAPPDADHRAEQSTRSEKTRDTRGDAVRLAGYPNMAPKGGMVGSCSYSENEKLPYWPQACLSSSR